MHQFVSTAQLRENAFWVSHEKRLLGFSDLTASTAANEAGNEMICLLH